jgi:hypothetical protein
MLSSHYTRTVVLILIKFYIDRPLVRLFVRERRKLRYNKKVDAPELLRSAQVCFPQHA